MYSLFLLIKKKREEACNTKCLVPSSLTHPLLQIKKQTQKKKEKKKKQLRETIKNMFKKNTLIKQFLSGLIRIHVGLLKGNINISIGVISNYFFNLLNSFPNSSR